MSLNDDAKNGRVDMVKQKLKDGANVNELDNVSMKSISINDWIDALDVVLQCHIIVW